MYSGFLPGADSGTPLKQYFSLNSAGLLKETGAGGAVESNPSVRVLLFNRAMTATNAIIPAIR